MIRSHQGELLAAFSSFYGVGTNNSAEFLAWKDGLNLCKNLHLSPVLIESDSMLVVAAIRFEKMDNWRLSYIYRKCLTLYTPEFEIVHRFRQKNMVTDRLADVVYSHRSHLEFFRERYLPRQIRKVLRADKLGYRALDLECVHYFYCYFM